jgi:hypothetical protein
MHRESHIGSLSSVRCRRGTSADLDFEPDGHALAVGGDPQLSARASTIRSPRPWVLWSCGSAGLGRSGRDRDLGAEDRAALIDTGHRAAARRDAAQQQRAESALDRLQSESDRARAAKDRQEAAVDRLATGDDEVEPDQRRNERDV